MSKAIGYARFSPRPNADECESIEGQRISIGEYCDRNGFALVGFHFDEIISGSKGLNEADRPNLWDAINSLKPGMVLVVRNIDRLARDSLLQATIERAVEKRRATIHSIEDGGELKEDAGSKFFRGILACFAEYNRHIINARTRAAARRKLAAGQKVNRAPTYGWMVDPDSPEGHYKHDPQERITIAKIWELRNSGLNVNKIVVWLNKNGWTRRKGKRWHPSDVWRLFEQEGDPNPQATLYLRKKRR